MFFLHAGFFFEIEYIHQSFAFEEQAFFDSERILTDSLDSKKISF